MDALLQDINGEEPVSAESRAKAKPKPKAKMVKTKMAKVKMAKTTVAEPTEVESEGDDMKEDDVVPPEPKTKAKAVVNSKMAKAEAKLLKCKAKATMKRPAAADVDVEVDAVVHEEAQSSGEGSLQLEMRDRIKARKFKELWDVLPDSVKLEFDQAGRCRDGTGRQRQTELVNNFIQRKGNKLVTMEHLPEFRELIERYKEKYVDEGTRGPTQHSLVALIQLHSSRCTHSC